MLDKVSGHQNYHKPIHFEQKAWDFLISQALCNAWFDGQKHYKKVERKKKSYLYD